MQGIAAPMVEKWVDTAWVESWVQIVPRCGGPFPLHPGSRTSHTTHLRAGQPSSNFSPKFPLASVPGLYRLNWLDVYSSFDGDTFSGELVPLERRVSNTFTLMFTP